MVCYREKVIKHFGQRNHEIKLCFPNLKLGAMCKIYANSQRHHRHLEKHRNQNQNCDNKDREWMTMAVLSPPILKKELLNTLMP